MPNWANKTQRIEQWQYILKPIEQMLPNTFFLDPTLTQLCMVFHFLCLIDSIFYKGLKSIVPERYSRGTITRTIKIPDFGIKTRCYRNFFYYCFNRLSSCTVREGFHEINGSVLIIYLIISFFENILDIIM